MNRQGDQEVDSWENVEALLETMNPDTTTVVTEIVRLGYDGWRVRWVPGTDLTPLGGISGSEDAQINYLTSNGDWLEVPALG